MQPASNQDRQSVIRAASLRPINLAMLFIGGGFFVITQAWWVVPLTLVTYALLVVLAARDPLFARRVLGESTEPDDTPDSISEVSPERRARWLPRGETRRRVEEALVAYRKLVSSIESSGEVTRSVLDDAVPKLHTAAERLVAVAHEREKAAEAVREMKSKLGDVDARNEENEEQVLVLRDLEDKITWADEEISGTYDRLMTLRARMVGASLNSDAENRAAASELSRSLDGLNFRLKALEEISSNPHDTLPEDGDRMP